jgi:hypothetical protein
MPQSMFNAHMPSTPPGKLRHCGQRVAMDCDFYLGISRGQVQHICDGTSLGSGRRLSASRKRMHLCIRLSYRRQSALTYLVGYTSFVVFLSAILYFYSIHLICFFIICIQQGETLISPKVGSTETTRMRASFHPAFGSFLGHALRSAAS